jgi:hypothetical protein
MRSDASLAAEAQIPTVKFPTPTEDNQAIAKEVTVTMIERPAVLDALFHVNTSPACRENPEEILKSQGLPQNERDFLLLWLLAEFRGSCLFTLKNPHNYPFPFTLKAGKNNHAIQCYPSASVAIDSDTLIARSSSASPRSRHELSILSEAES